ncbi:hypothetical protein RvY_07118 [Ramazzottius varieornatus]|uniref:NADP-dependent oxidoreductase domain-containing protein n=1 Tax=Ramazzottius varieornatus TaxID=947166 RepID=A0A1D1V0X7_RAMVA|nr:hypothetical protein RvY_07118 [Ramazzottius varieornatus]
MAVVTKVPTIQLNDGNRMPIMAMGTSEKRKLTSHCNDPKYVREDFDISKNRLKVDYVDLYLVHSPMSIKKEQTGLNAQNYLNKPEDPEAFFNNVDHADVRKVECHAYLPQNKLVDFCKQNWIAVTAYAPIGCPGYTGQGQVSNPGLLDEPVLKIISEKYHKTPAQILLRWLIQRDIGVLPKSIHKDRLKENFEVFDFKLNSDDMQKINELGARNHRLFTHAS